MNRKFFISHGLSPSLFIRGYATLTNNSFAHVGGCGHQSRHEKDLDNHRRLGLTLWTQRPAPRRNGRKRKASEAVYEPASQANQRANRGGEPPSLQDPALFRSTISIPH
jgi:hypothetical protein